MDDCPNCASLQNKVSQLIGGVAGTLALINAEHEEQTMSRNELVRHVQERLHDTLTSGH